MLQIEKSCSRDAFLKKKIRKNLPGVKFSGYALGEIQIGSLWYYRHYRSWWLHIGPKIIERVISRVFENQLQISCIYIIQKL